MSLYAKQFAPFRLFLTGNKSKDKDKAKNAVTDKNQIDDEDEIYCTCMQPWDNRYCKFTFQLILPVQVVIYISIYIVLLGL